MEEKKNNAIEKVENIIKEKRKKHGGKDRADDEPIDKHNGAPVKNSDTHDGQGYFSKSEDGEREKVDSVVNHGAKPTARRKRGLIAATVTLSIATFILAAAFTLSLVMPNEQAETLERAYKQTFYDAVTRVDDIDLNISKVMASKDDDAKQEYLLDLAVNSEAVGNDLSELPLEDESRFYTVKLINQIGDFAKYASKKLINGESLSEQDYEILKTLYKANKNLKNSLKEVADNAEGLKFTDLKRGDKGGLLIEQMNMLENLSVEFPELIYDGPFSDGLSDVSIKGLSGGAVTRDQAKTSFTEIFSDMKYTNLKNEGETATGIECYNFSATVKDEYLYAEISKTGGKLINFAYSGSCKSTEIERASAIEIALSFAGKAGITGITPVWVNLANNLFTINFAFEKDGVIIYSDLVKIRVCAETGMVIGYDAESYYYNHTEREIGTPALSKAECEGKVYDGIDIQTARLCLVPIGNNAEKLCYEFSGEMDGATYYVYIDVENGRQVQMFKVVEGTEGELLM